MFPQALVQNKIISQSNDNFALNWAAAAPILNANYFYVDKLIEESQKYRKLLRPWTETEPGDPNFQVHEYYSAIESVPGTGDTNTVCVGDWVGRVRKTNTNNVLDDCLILTRSIGYYIYDDVAQKLVPNNVAGVPCVVRPSVWGLVSPLQIDLNNSAIQRIDGHYQYICRSSDIQFKSTTSDNIPLAYTTDAVMGRIIYDNHLLARVPVTILRKWNARLINYEFALQFPDFNFPPSAKVEFW